MNDIAYESITKIMETLLNMPTNGDFKYPIEQIQDFNIYKEKIARPIDLHAINEKVKRKEYKNPHDWYNDVCLVYENCIEYYDPNQSYYPKIADYNMQIFKKLAVGFDCNDTESWYALLRKTFDKLINVAGNSPVPQGLDPWLSALPTHAEIAIPLTPSEIADTVAFLNKELQQDDESKASLVRKDVYTILKEMQPNLKLDAEENVIKAQDLDENTRRVLNAYYKAHLKT